MDTSDVIKEVQRLEISNTHSLLVRYKSDMPSRVIYGLFQELQGELDEFNIKIIPIPDTFDIYGTLSNTDVAILKLQGKIDA